jgi:hypothetical protein
MNAYGYLRRIYAGQHGKVVKSSREASRLQLLRRYSMF